MIPDSSGAQVPRSIDLLKSDLKELQQDEINLFKALANDNFDDYDERRLKEIHDEIADLEKEIKSRP
ncbi:hypothetical protein ABEH00_09965 [Pantoea agglomerans]|uniref:hypothetical protein n=1 Tax=Enterobacter agglomerans TaxID=549 RepID=UPI00165425A0|nr:hypothetical protein [Pantoea agglomerans]MBD8157230.1 hypothetical protein [Pantoea agglomerans]MBD8234638.1 hypothetical protein [Pantoea agglomerans]